MRPFTDEEKERVWDMHLSDRKRDEDRDPSQAHRAVVEMLAEAKPFTRKVHDPQVIGLASQVGRPRPPGGWNAGRQVNRHRCPSPFQRVLPVFLVLIRS